jgi:hypothetical protein
MSNEKDGSSGFKKKKYLYLDKFEKYKEEQNVWGLSTNERLKKLKDRADAAIWYILIGCVLSVGAILISVIK